MANERERHDERYDAAPVVFDGSMELLTHVGVQSIAKVAEHVLEGVHVSLRRRRLRERAHELFGVPFAQLGTVRALGAGDDAAETSLRLGGVGHEQQLLAGLEIDEVADLPAALEQAREPIVGEDADDEALAQARVVQSAFFLDGQQRQQRHEGVGEQAAIRGRRHARLGVGLDARHAAARRVLLEDVAAQSQLAKLTGAPLCVLAHRRGVVDAACRGDHADAVARAHQAQRLARHAEPDVELGTHRHEAEVAAEHVGDVVVMLVPAVEADFLAEQAGRDTDGDLVVGGGYRRCSLHRHGSDTLRGEGVHSQR